MLGLEAAWPVGHHGVRAYHLRHHPVLTRPLTEPNLCRPVVVAVEADRARTPEHAELSGRRAPLPGRAVRALPGNGG